jgi:hypothetical protein
MSALAAPVADKRFVTSNCLSALSVAPYNRAFRISSKGVMKNSSIVKMAAVLLLPAVLGGCGVLAAPCRVGSAVIKMVPVVGHAAALPTDACAAVIDP